MLQSSVMDLLILLWPVTMVLGAQILGVEAVKRRVGTLTQQQQGPLVSLQKEFHESGSYHVHLK